MFVLTRRDDRARPTEAYFCAQPRKRAPEIRAAAITFAPPGLRDSPTRGRGCSRIFPEGQLPHIRFDPPLGRL